MLAWPSRPPGRGGDHLCDRPECVILSLIVLLVGLLPGLAVRVDEEDGLLSSVSSRTDEEDLSASFTEHFSSIVAFPSISTLELGTRSSLEENQAASSVGLLAALLVLFMSGFCVYRLFRINESQYEDDGEVPLWPTILFVHDAFGYEGTYRIVRGEQPNGLPLWKKENSNDWVFCGLGGQWFVGDEDEYRLGFKCNTGNIASFEEHAGRMPDEIGPGGWLFFNGTEWVPSENINITSELFGIADQEATAASRRTHEAAASKIQSRFRGNTSRRRCNQLRQARAAQLGQSDGAHMWPEVLYVTKAKGYSGTYRIVSGMKPNGLPLWKKEGSTDWIFCGEGGQWLIGDEDEERMNFQCDTGNIASSEENAGRLPDEIGRGGWLYFNGSKWEQEPEINITSDLFTEKDQEVATSMRTKRNSAASKIQAKIRGSQTRVQIAQENMSPEGEVAVPLPAAVKKAGMLSRARGVFGGKTK